MPGRYSLAVFLGGMVTCIWVRPEARPTFRFGSFRGFACGNQLLHPSPWVFRHPGAFSLPRRRIALSASSGILTGSSIRLAVRLSVRSRLTLIRLALIRNPWSFGGGAFHPPYRYSFLHLPFRLLQHASGRTFAGAGMLPYQLSLVPRLRRAA